MQIHLKNQTNDETAYATVRMHRRDYRELREYMHAQKGPADQVEFPDGVALVKYGCGWYRLVTNRNNRSVDRLKFAIKVIGMFRRDQEEQVTEQIRQELALLAHPDVRPVAYCVTLPDQKHSIGEFVFASQQKPVVAQNAKALGAQVASAAKLAALTQKFGKRT